MGRVEKRAVLITTHLGVLAVAFFFTRNLSAPSTPSKETPTHPSARVVAAKQVQTWIRNELFLVQEESQRRAADITFAKTATLPQRMERDQQERKAKNADLLEEIESIRGQASQLGRVANPHREILDGLKREENTNILFSIALWWLRNDRETALKELSEPAFDELLKWNSGLAGALLHTEFGSAWAANSLRSNETPSLLRALLAKDLGRVTGQGGGLLRLADEFRSLNDPFLQVELVDSFLRWWKLEEPASSAHFLLNQAPPALRDLFLGELVSRFSLNHSWDSWREELNKHLVKADLPDYVTELALTFPLSEPLGFWDPKPPESRSLAEQLASYSGGDDDPAHGIIRSLVLGWIDEGTDLRELYGEGRITREELLDKLAERIPGAAEHPNHLEQAAWLATVGHSSPQRAEAWARSLSSRSLFPREHFRLAEAIKKDPRQRMALERLRFAIALTPTKDSQNAFQRQAQSHFADWIALGPRHARRWRDSIPNLNLHILEGGGP